MPKVGKKKFPYTKGGKAAAKKEAAKRMLAKLKFSFTIGKKKGKKGKK
jgi:hypothetical protein|tara:strand:- start:502 stop:645 length:144 start_codon:yes stop_codon:yes gene_type:complete